MENKRKIESEIDFKALLKNPTRLFGLVFIYFFVIALVIGLYYLDVMNTTAFNTFPGTSLDTLNIEREITPKVGGIKPAMDLELIKSPTKELIAIGKTKYDMTCASCHGNDGKGDGVAAAALDPKPRNFHDLEGWTNGRTFYDIYKSLHDGVPGTGMTAYEFLPAEDRVAIIHYLRTFADFPAVTDDEVKNKLDATYNLSAGIVVPNNISIKKSITLISEENQKDVDLSILISNKINDDKNNSANILKENVTDIEKVVYSFISKLNKNDYNSFVKTLNTDPVAFGFKASVVNLNDGDLRSIYTYLFQNLKKEQS